MSATPGACIMLATCSSVAKSSHCWLAVSLTSSRRNRSRNSGGAFSANARPRSVATATTTRRLVVEALAAQEAGLFQSAEDAGHRGLAEVQGFRQRAGRHVLAGKNLSQDAELRRGETIVLPQLARPLFDRLADAAQRHHDLFFTRQRIRIGVAVHHWLKTRHTASIRHKCDFVNRKFCNSARRDRDETLRIARVSEKMAQCRLESAGARLAFIERGRRATPRTRREKSINAQ